MVKATSSGRARSRTCRPTCRTACRRWKTQRCCPPRASSAASATASEFGDGARSSSGSVPELVDLDLRLAHEVAPGLGLLAHELAELLRRLRDGDAHHLLRQAVLLLGLGEHA